MIMDRKYLVHALVKRSATELCVKGSIRAVCKINKRSKRVSMAEIVTCVRCGQWVRDPENGRVCAECKAADIEDENREEIEFALAHLDALTAIEMSADANAGGCYSPELLDRWDAMGDGNRRQRMLIKALILVGARLDLMYQREAGQDPLELIRATMFAGHTKER
jgi:hypothetical protein